MSRATTTGLQRAARRTAPADTPTSRQPRRNTTSSRDLMYRPYVSRSGPVLSCRVAPAPNASYSHMSDYVARGGEPSSSATRRKRRYRQGVSNRPSPKVRGGPRRSATDSVPRRIRLLRPATTGSGRCRRRPIAAAPVLSGVGQGRRISVRQERPPARGWLQHLPPSWDQPH